MHGLLDHLNEAGSIGAKAMFVLNNMFARDILKRRDIEAALGTQIGLDLPYDAFLYLKAVNEGVPIVMGAPRSAAAERLGKLSSTAFGTDGVVVPVAEPKKKPGCSGCAAGPEARSRSPVDLVASRAVAQAGQLASSSATAFSNATTAWPGAATGNACPVAPQSLQARNCFRIASYWSIPSRNSSTAGAVQVVGVYAATPSFWPVIHSPSGRNWPSSLLGSILLRPLRSGIASSAPALISLAISVSSAV